MSLTDQEPENDSAADNELVAMFEREFVPAARRLSEQGIQTLVTGFDAEFPGEWCLRVTCRHRFCEPGRSRWSYGPARTHSSRITTTGFAGPSLEIRTADPDRLARNRAV